MSNIVVRAAAEIDGAPAEVYALLSDYRVGHPSILPKPYFKEVIVEEGGQGAGTVVRVLMAVMGKDYPYHLIVSEPEPGRVLQETDLEQDLVTTFTSDPLSGGLQTRLTITTTLKASPGLKGALEKLLYPMTLRPIYKKELQNIAARIRERHDASNASFQAASTAK
jgi:hypothetical protein